MLIDFEILQDLLSMAKNLGRRLTVHHWQTALFTLLWVCSHTALAQTIHIPLPGLPGVQSVGSLESMPVFPLGPSVEVPISSLPSRSNLIGLEWSGTISAGRVIGDGIERAPIEAILRGTFSASLDAPGHSYGAFPAYQLPTTGPFQAFWELHGPIGGFVDRNCLDCEYPPEVWKIRLQLIPDFFALGDSIPFLAPPVDMELRFAHQGLILLEGIEASIDSAKLVFELVPEPATSALVFVAIAIIVGMQWRSGRLNSTRLNRCRC